MGGYGLAAVNTATSVGAGVFGAAVAFLNGTVSVIGQKMEQASYCSKKGV